MTGRRATVSLGTDGVGETYGGGTASSIAAAANAAAAAIRAAATAAAAAKRSGGGSRSILRSPPPTSEGGGNLDRVPSFSLSRDMERSHHSCILILKNVYRDTLFSLPYIGERETDCPKGNPVKVRGFWPKTGLKPL